MEIVFVNEETDIPAVSVGEGWYFIVEDIQLLLQISYEWMFYLKCLT